MTRAREIDNQFEWLKAYVSDPRTWSNIEIENRVLDLYPLVCPTNYRSMHFFKSAVKAARESGSTRVINAALTRLQDSLKEHP